MMTREWIRRMAKMARRGGRRAFSLVEVNMAIFVMAVGALGLIALYPLGLRESSQAKADMLESIFADNLLNQAVGIASQTDIKWSEWNKDNKNPLVPYSTVNKEKTLEFKSMDSFNDLPDFLRKGMKMPDLVANDSAESGVRHFRIACCRPPAHSGRVMGILVQCTTEYASDRNDFSNHPIYYAEAYFQGDATK